MPPSAPLTFQDVTEEQYARLAEKARGAGIDMADNSGSAEKFGVEVAWNYDPASRQLALQCLKVPFFMNADDVDAKVRSLVNEALG